jgi:methionyl-tRNA synthetase
MDGKRRIFIGAAWPYANGDLHLGHVAGCLLPADIFARYCRLRGYSVLFVSGSDMHGTPITVTADKEGITPEQVAMRTHNSILRTIKDLDMTYDLYTHTHTDHHFKVVHEIFLDLLGKGLIEKRTQEAPFCPKCDRFMPDRYIEGTCPECGFGEARGDQCDKCGKVHDPKDLGSPRCKLCGTAPAFKETEHFFLLLSNLQERIRSFVSANEGHWRPNTRNNTENFLSAGLRDRAITRDLQWGVPIPLPGNEGKCIYVWFEAVCGYLSAARLYFLQKGDPEGYRDYWEDPACRHYYFLAKDNIPFHTIIWPAILLGKGGLNLPYDVPANEYLQWDGSQFSKSRGHGVTVNGFLQDYPVDPLRFYLSTNMPERSDADFDLREFVQKNNTELLGAIGNLLHRVASFVHTNFGTVPRRGDLSAEDERILAASEKAYVTALDSMEEVRLKDGIRTMVELANEANRYFNDMAPWKLLRTDKARCGTVLAVSLSVCKTLAFGLYPYIPRSMTRWCEMMGIPGPADSKWTDALVPFPEGHILAKPETLFARIELKEKEEAADEKVAPAQSAPASPTISEAPKGKAQPAKPQAAEAKPAVIPYDEFARVDLRVGKVLDIQPHPNADKLFVLKVDLGEPQPRQIVAGLRKHYKAEEILGRYIVVVSNLQPVKMRGIDSNGMLLAGDDGSVVSILTSDKDVKPGSPVH